MTHTAPRLILAALLATALIATGCGDDEEEALTQEEWVAQADTICREGDQVINQEAEALGQGRPSPDELEQFTSETLVPEIQSQVDDIDELQPPEEIEADVDEFIDSAQSALDEIESDPSVLFSDEDAFGETSELARDLGLEDCAEG